jgi:glycosyltransferase involved in cell wall biosynthesis
MSNYLPHQNKGLLVASGLSGGGAERRAALVANAIPHLDVAVFLAEAGQGIRMPRKILGWRGRLSYPMMVLRLRRLLVTGSYKVAIAFGGYPNLVLWFASRFMRNPPRIVLTEITRPTTNLNSDPNPFRRALARACFRLAYSRADLFAANSIDGIRESVEDFGVPAQRAVRLFNPVDSVRLRRLAAEPSTTAPSCDFLIVFSCRFDAMKRADTLLLAVSHIPRTRGWKVIIIGDGAQRHQIASTIQARGLEDRVIMTGWLNNPFPLIAKGDVFVHCSEWEGFSNSVIEAMFLDVPVVTSYCSTDAREMCEAGAAIGYEVGDAGALADILANMIEHPHLLTEVKNRARAYRARFEVEAAMEGYRDLLQRAGLDTAKSR